MVRLPVFGVFGRAIRFVVLDFFTIVRLTWLPLLLFAALTTAGSVALFDRAWASKLDATPWSPGPALQPLYDAFVAVYPFTSLVLQLVTSAAAAVALHRVILFNDRQPGRYVVFPFGWTELRYVVMIVLWSLFSFSLLIPFIAMLAFIGPISPDVAWLWNDSAPRVAGEFVAWTVSTVTAATRQLSPGEALGVFAGILFMFALQIWLSIRLFVWPAALVARRKLSLGYSWSLTYGNSWAIFGLYLLSIVLAFAVFFASLTALPQAFRGPDGYPFPPLSREERTRDPNFRSIGNATAPLAEPALTGLEAEPYRSPRPDINAVLRFLVWNQTILLLLNFVFVGYSVALISYSYRALSGHDPSQAEA